MSITVTVFSPCYVGINCCNVTLFLYTILSFQNIILISSPMVIERNSGGHGA